MYGDPAQIRAVATRLRALAADASAERAPVLAGLDVEWQSAASDTFRRELQDWDAALSDSADELHEAADAVDRHARAVEERIAAIQAAEAWARQQIAELRDTASGVVDRIGAAAMGLVDDVASFARDRLDSLPADLPSPGDVRWLDLSSGLGGRR